MSDNTSKRIEYIDLTKGFCIILVILYHLQSFYSVQLCTDAFLFSFFLSTFVFVSGFFFNNQKGFKYFIKSKTNSLLIPFFFFYITTSVLVPNIAHYVLGIHIQTVVGWPSLWAFIIPCEFPNIPLWFLWCLYITNFLFFLISYTRRILIIGFICILLGFVGFLFQWKGSQLPAFLNNVLMFMPFFFVGHLYKKKGMFRRIKKKKTTIIITIVAGIITWFISITLKDTEKFYLTLLRYYIAGIIGAFFILFLSRWIHQLSYVTYLGRYSIAILVTHDLLILAFSQISKFFPLPHYAQVFLVLSCVLLCYTFLIPLMRKYFAFFIAQKELIH